MFECYEVCVTDKSAELRNLESAEKKKPIRSKKFVLGVYSFFVVLHYLALVFGNSIRFGSVSITTGRKQRENCLTRVV